jgi:hypothetical protein
MEIWSTLPVSVKGLAKGATVAWKSSDKAVATVTKDKTGQAAKLYVKKVGKAKITAKVTVDKKVTATYTLTVTVKDSTAKAAVTPTAAPTAKPTAAPTPTATAKPTAAPTPTAPVTPTPTPSVNNSLVGVWTSHPESSKEQASRWIEFKSDGTYSWYRFDSGMMINWQGIATAVGPPLTLEGSGNYSVVGNEIHCTNASYVKNHKETIQQGNVTWLFYFSDSSGNSWDDRYPNVTSWLFVNMDRPEELDPEVNGYSIYVNEKYVVPSDDITSW